MALFVLGAGATEGR